ncbi:hypothetical protein [Streptomyces sp. N2A]|uniref:hypothetical protein n=1 Tax=Streptomyces sp. N2A TaxID=3073936 RepID=UPI00286FB200|nr:hypothetical protein [Streptomyces sp. N2A]
MSVTDPLNVGDRVTVEAARRSLTGTSTMNLGTASETALLTTIADLQWAAEALLSIIDALPVSVRSQRLAAQKDKQFLNLARATRMQIRSAQGSLHTLDRYADALLRMTDDAAGE